jgi:hypothetical protein
MNANVECQIVSKQEKERRSFEQSSHQVLSEKMKKQLKRVSSEKSTQNLRDAKKKYHVKKMKLHKNLIKSKNFLAINMKTKCIKLINYFYFRRVFIVLISNCICEHSNKRYDIFYSFAEINQRIVNACCATTTRQT